MYDHILGARATIEAIDKTEPIFDRLQGKSLPPNDIGAKYGTIAEGSPAKGKGPCMLMIGVLMKGNKSMVDSPGKGLEQQGNALVGV